MGKHLIGSFFRKGNLIVTTSCAFESTNRFIAQVFANDQINVEVFMRNKRKLPLMKGLTAVMYIAGTMVTATIRHLVAVVDTNGEVITNKPK